jgi:CDP-diacylglycerol--serine O-phosphatidyltransferase
MEYKLAGLAELSPVIGHFFHRFVWLAAAVYISCAAIRLARFNVENEEDESAHMSFVGLPIPAAAGVVISLVVFHQDTLLELSNRNTGAYVVCENAIIYALPFLLLGLAVLMVSRIRYAHILNQYIKGKKPFAHLIWLLLGIGLAVWSIQIALVLIFCSFAASGFAKWLYYRIIRRRSGISPAIQAHHEGPLMAVDRADTAAHDDTA